jgi:hypothetical protein
MEDKCIVSDGFVGSFEELDAFKSYWPFSVFFSPLEFDHSIVKI